MKLKKTSSALLLSLMVLAGGAQANGALSALTAVGDIAGAIKGANVTVGNLKNSNITAAADASGENAEAMAGGIVNASPKKEGGLAGAVSDVLGGGGGPKIMVGDLENATINAKATASGANSGAYAGGMVAK